MAVEVAVAAVAVAAVAVAAVVPGYEMAAEHFLNERVSGALLSQNVSEVWKGNKHGNYRFLVIERGLVICKHVTTLSIQSSVSIQVYEYSLVIVLFVNRPNRE